MHCKVEVGETTLGFLCGCKKVAFCSLDCQLKSVDEHKPTCVIIRKFQKLPGYVDVFKLPSEIENDIRVLGKTLTKENPGIIGFSIYNKPSKNTKKLGELYYEVKILPSFLLKLTGIVDGFLYCLNKTDTTFGFIPVMKFTQTGKEITSYAIGLLSK
jgi:hypothetical protein